jgi:hypothetical protein
VNTPAPTADALAWPAAAGESASQSSRVREAALLAEHQDRRFSCFCEAGIRVERDPDGGWLVSSAGLGDDAFLGIEAICTKRIGGYPQVIPETRAELAGLYGLHIETMKCLEAQGVTVRQPPSREKWIEDSVSNPEGPWLPYESPGAFDYEDVCPAADLYHLYGVDPYNSAYQPR